MAVQSEDVANEPMGLAKAHAMMSDVRYLTGIQRPESCGGTAHA